LGKIKIFYPKKHSISYTAMMMNMFSREMVSCTFLYDIGRKINWTRW